MKLSSLGGRLQSSHGITATFTPELVEELARRCTEAETGARNVEHVLRGSLMPLLAREILERMASSAKPKKLEVGLGPDGGWRVEFA
jgi:type VI secretion system protein VasG